MEDRLWEYENFELIRPVKEALRQYCVNNMLKNGPQTMTLGVVEKAISIVEKMKLSPEVDERVAIAACRGVLFDTDVFYYTDCRALEILRFYYSVKKGNLIGETGGGCSDAGSLFYLCDGVKVIIDHGATNYGDSKSRVVSHQSLVSSAGISLTTTIGSTEGAGKLPQFPTTRLDLPPTFPAHFPHLTAPYADDPVNHIIRFPNHANHKMNLRQFTRSNGDHIVDFGGILSDPAAHQGTNAPTPPHVRSECHHFFQLQASRLWDKYIASMKTTQVPNPWVLKEPTVAIIGEAAGSALSRMIMPNSLDDAPWIKIVVNTTTMLGFACTFAGIGMRRARPNLAGFMTKAGAMAIALAVILSMGTALPPALAWPVGAAAFALVAIAVAAA